MADTPYMHMREAQIFYDLILSHGLQDALELGFFHGVSTAYIAGAIKETGGHVTTIDLETAKARTPNIENTLERCGLRDLVDVYYEPKTFNWRLMHFLSAEPPQTFDLCYIDGGHTWVDTGFAFCLVRQMLRPGGWIVFDDLPHTFRDSSNRDKSWVRRMTEEEQVTPQVEQVFRLLVMRDPSFGCFRRIGNLGLAFKKRAVTWNGLSTDVEADLCLASQRARLDPEYRRLLLRMPARALAMVGRRPEQLYRGITFEESGTLAPLEPLIEESGTSVHYLERPEWDKRLTEDELLAMLHHQS